MQSRKNIDKVVFDVLKNSGVLGEFPTPVDKILNYSELVVNDNRDITEIPKHYRTRSVELLKKALRKLNGILDRQEKTIYIDPNQLPSRKKFVKLHEVGHHVLPWQRKFYEIIEDDETTVSSDVTDDFEIEANLFASGALFQLDRFEEEMRKLPLEIGSPMALAKTFGASNHATLRRYVEYSPKRCALLVLKDKKELQCSVRNYFQSPSFTAEFGTIKWDETLGIEWSFVEDYILNRRFHMDGELDLVTGDGEMLSFDYHYFNNTWNAFILIKPVGEYQSSKTKIVLRSSK